MNKIIFCLLFLLPTALGVHHKLGCHFQRWHYNSEQQTIQALCALYQGGLLKPGILSDKAVTKRAYPHCRTIRSADRFSKYQ